MTQTQPYPITSTHWFSVHTFSAKEKDEESGYCYFGARYYDSDVSVWLSVDPMSDLYPSLSSYNYCGVNPILFKDLDGNSFIIWYKEGGKSKQFEFDGSNYKSAPNNPFVQQFLKAYKFDVINGGGSSLLIIATSKQYKVDVVQTNNTSSAEVGNAIFWNPYNATLETDGYVLSPAMVLEEEATHYLHWLTNPNEHWNLHYTPVKNYDNAEERRTIRNELSKTVRANKEVPAIWVGKNHHGTPIGVDDPTSNRPTKSSNSTFYKKLKNDTPYDWTKQEKKANNFISKKK